MENTYGIGIANRYELFYDQDDVVDFETVITKKKKSKEPATAQQTPAPAAAVQQKSVAEKENKQVKKDTGTGQQKVTPDQQRRGIKEQSNNSNKDAAPRKDGGEFSFYCLVFPFLENFSQRLPHVVCVLSSFVREEISVSFRRALRKVSTKCMKVHLEKIGKCDNRFVCVSGWESCERTRITFSACRMKIQIFVNLCR